MKIICAIVLLLSLSGCLWGSGGWMPGSKEPDTEQQAKDRPDAVEADK
jgi:hypothetical protein